ncbi:uncharacterized protein [Nicotiana sylvestris]|uniref:Uncharacterized protein LOC104228011 n=1 Tax=Nicotiana sylvestris TaxID=4096 RepID=A0A1U7WN29_NICSY|nr:PREDICTED: uncharacterized protein LOC104228011 [Nicotiana sylvestris]
MASKLPKLLSLLLFFPLVLNFTARTSGQECPYPCYPPPTGTGNNSPVALTPPYSQGYNYFPPPSIYNNNPAAGGSNFPYYNSPPNFVNGVVPPPPDPILPWWPYRYKNRPNYGDQYSSSVSIQESRTLIMISIVPLLSLFVTLFLH